MMGFLAVWNIVLVVLCQVERFCAQINCVLRFQNCLHAKCYVGGNETGWGECY